MNTFTVNVYIETSIKGPRPQAAAGMWLAEYVTSRGIPVTRQGDVWKDDTTENDMTLELMLQAFSEITKPCSVRVNIRCGHILNAVCLGWPERWVKNGWMGAKGRPVENKELWQELVKKMEYHAVVFELGDHPYRMVMQDRLRRIMEKEGKDEFTESEGSCGGSPAGENKRSHEKGRGQLEGSEHAMEEPEAD